VNESYTATDALTDRCCWLGVLSARSFFYEYCQRWYSQLIAPRCWRLACSNSRHSTSSETLCVWKICS